jgi:DNA-binding transcriptional MerR regulator
MVGVSRSTLLRWLKQGVLKDASHRDRRGWRLFTQTDIQRIEAEANRVR